MTTWTPLETLTGLLPQVELDWEAALSLLQAVAAGQHTLYLVGNGGSAAIASHLQVDAWKRARLRAHTFLDAPSLTAASNDVSFRDAFALPLRSYARRGDGVWAISSSGASPNILHAARTAQMLGCRILTCSGFDADNPLRALGDVSAYVPSHDYGLVEVAHLAIGHALLDRLAVTR